MASIEQIKESIAKDEVAASIVIKEKDGNPYLAPSSTADEPVPCTISVLGSDAKRVQAARDRIQRRMLRMRRTSLEPADLRVNRIEEATAAVTSWFGWTYGPDSAPLPCTPENVQAMLAAEHILVQVEAAVAGHSDFSQTASQT